MIKVLSTVPHKSVVKEVVCPTCGSTLEYAPVDIEKRICRDYGGGSDVTSFITCPTCSKEVILSSY